MNYVALLRGINVGGNKLMKMTDVRACLEARAFKHVSTYIQSGNVLFESDRSDAAKLAATMEKAFAAMFGHEVPVFLRSQAQLKKIVEEAPTEWKTSKSLRQNVAFLRAPLTATRVLTDVDPKPGVDSIQAGDGVVYMSTVMSRRGQSRFPKIVGTPIYADMTIRSFNTCEKILTLMQAERVED